jgi:actin-related protein 6
VFQNCLVKTRDKKVYYGADIEELQDHGGLVYRRPFEKVSAIFNNLSLSLSYANDNAYNVHLQGLLTSWNPENLIFNDIFTRFPNIDATTTSLLITEPYLNPPALGENYDQMMFEEWEFASYARSCGESSVWLGSG